MVHITETVTHLVEDPRAEDCLQEVVHNKYITKIQRFLVLHHPGAQDFGKVRVGQTDCQRWEGTAHHGPVVYARICGKE
jgi:hypothetical protein